MLKSEARCVCCGIMSVALLMNCIPAKTFAVEPHSVLEEKIEYSFTETEELFREDDIKGSLKTAHVKQIKDALPVNTEGIFVFQRTD